MLRKTVLSSENKNCYKNKLSLFHFRTVPLTGKFYEKFFKSNVKVVKNLHSEKK